jgi:hypothetical protein
MARGSLGEAGDQIEDGAESGYFTESQRIEMIRLMKRACKANSGLRRYLETAQNMRKRSSLTGRMKQPSGPNGPKNLLSSSHFTAAARGRSR